MTIAKHHVDFAFVTGRRKSSSLQIFQISQHEIDATIKTVANRHHFACPVQLFACSTGRLLSFLRAFVP